MLTLVKRERESNLRIGQTLHRNKWLVHSLERERENKNKIKIKSDNLQKHLEFDLSDCGCKS